MKTAEAEGRHYGHHLQGEEHHQPEHDEGEVLRQQRQGRGQTALGEMMVTMWSNIKFTSSLLTCVQWLLYFVGT